LPFCCHSTARNALSSALGAPGIVFDWRMADDPAMMPDNP
jgi:hypothetical protein